MPPMVLLVGLVLNAAVSLLSFLLTTIFSGQSQNQ